MGAQLVENLPPLGKKAANPHLLEAGRLAKVNPDQWVKVGVRMSQSMATQIKQGRSSIGAGFNAVTRDNRENTADLYIRYIGEGN